MIKLSIRIVQSLVINALYYVCKDTNFGRDNLSKRVEFTLHTPYSISGKTNVSASRDAGSLVLETSIFSRDNVAISNPSLFSDTG